MTNLHDARVEAAVDEYLKLHLDEAGRPSIRESMRAAIAAADAVVTVEMIAEAVRGFFEPFIESNGTQVWVAMQTDVGIVDDISASVLAVLRGGGRG